MTILSDKELGYIFFNQPDLETKLLALEYLHMTMQRVIEKEHVQKP